MNDTVQETHNVQDFFTLDKANQGRQLPPALPSGKLTDYYVNVVSRHSDIASKALEIFNRSRLLNSMKPEDERKTDRELRIPALASTIVGWNLPQEFNTANVENFVRNAPQIAEAIDRFSWDDAGFFGEE